MKLNCRLHELRPTFISEPQFSESVAPSLGFAAGTSTVDCVRAMVVITTTPASRIGAAVVIVLDDIIINDGHAKFQAVIQFSNQKIGHTFSSFDHESSAPTIVSHDLQQPDPVQLLALLHDIFVPQQVFVLEQVGSLSYWRPSSSTMATPNSKRSSNSAIRKSGTLVSPFRHNSLLLAHL